MFINYEALKFHLKKLQNACDGAIVIVEGKRDVAALRSLLNADFFMINGAKRSLFETAEHIASNWRSAILLFDNDAKGMELRKKMSSYLRSHGVRVLEEKKLLELARVRDVEDLCSTAIIEHL